LREVGEEEAWMIEKQAKKKSRKIAHSNNEIAKRKRKTTSTLRH
jgi:hypothetical protein